MDLILFVMLKILIKNNLENIIIRKKIKHIQII